MKANSILILLACGIAAVAFASPTEEPTPVVVSQSSDDIASLAQSVQGLLATVKAVDKDVVDNANRLDTLDLRLSLLEADLSTEPEETVEAKPEALKELPPVVKPPVAVTGNRGFVDYVVQNYRGTEYVETGTNDARASHLVSYHGSGYFTMEDIAHLDRRGRRRLHGAAHTGQLGSLRNRYTGNTTSSSVSPTVYTSRRVMYRSNDRDCFNGSCRTNNFRMTRRRR